MQQTLKTNVIVLRQRKKQILAAKATNLLQQTTLALMRHLQQAHLNLQKAVAVVQKNK